MQYALLIYAHEAALGPDDGSTALSELVARHMAFSRELGPTRIGGVGLKSTASATTVRTQGGAKTVHDGPFAETKEQLLGFFIVECASLEQAIATAKDLGAASSTNGSYEIRPLRLLRPEAPRP